VSSLIALVLPDVRLIMTQMEWGYALSLFAYIRKEQQPPWADYLCKNVKADFKQGQYFISANEDMIFQQE
jgi:hypothetical protein